MVQLAAPIGDQRVNILDRFKVDYTDALKLHYSSHPYDASLMSVWVTGLWAGQKDIHEGETQGKVFRKKWASTPKAP